MPCPHFDVKIIQRSKRQSAVASAAYQSGERLFSEYDQKQKYYSHKSEIVHTEIMLPPHAPPEYADRNTLWNAAEAIEQQWNSQLARRFVTGVQTCALPICSSIPRMVKRIWAWGLPSPLSWMAKSAIMPLETKNSRQ